TVAPSKINPAQVRLSVLESSRTSNGLTLKANRHPRGMLINYFFFWDRDMIGNPHEKWVESYNNHTRVCGSEKVQSLNFTNRSQISSGKIIEFLTRFHTVDNDKLMTRNHILPLT